MTFSLQVLNGDLAMRGSELGIVYGVNKLTQDLTLWLTERYGIDRFHPQMGSNFQNYIGGIINYSTESMITNETNRVLDNYAKVQMRGFRESPSIYALAELMASVNQVSVGITYDTVSVAINVSNAIRQSTTISTTQGT